MADIQFIEESLFLSPTSFQLSETALSGIIRLMKMLRAKKIKDIWERLEISPLEAVPNRP